MYLYLRPACDDVYLEGVALSLYSICLLQVPAALLLGEGTWGCGAGRDSPTGEAAA